MKCHKHTKLSLPFRSLLLQEGRVTGSTYKCNMSQALSTTRKKQSGWAQGGGIDRLWLGQSGKAS